MMTSIINAGAFRLAGQNPLLPASYDIIWSAVCFFIILIAFWRVFLPKLQVLLDERAAAIEGNIETVSYTHLTLPTNREV